jgi:hypothetical protein
MVSPISERFTTCEFLDGAFGTAPFHCIRKGSSSRIDPPPVKRALYLGLRVLELGIL